MRMPADHLGRDRLDHIAERKGVLLFRHAGMKHHLQQQVAEFVAQITEIAPRDGVGDLIGLLDGVGRDGRKILFEIPRTAAAGRPQLRHDVEQTGDIAGRGHDAPSLRDQALVCRKTPVQPSAGRVLSPVIGVRVRRC